MSQGELQDLRPRQVNLSKEILKSFCDLRDAWTVARKHRTSHVHLTVCFTPDTGTARSLGASDWPRQDIFNAINCTAASPARFLDLFPPHQSQSGGCKGSAWKQHFPL